MDESANNDSTAAVATKVSGGSSTFLFSTAQARSVLHLSGFLFPPNPNWIHSIENLKNPASTYDTGTVTNEAGVAPQ